MNLFKNKFGGATLYILIAFLISIVLIVAILDIVFIVVQNGNYSLFPPFDFNEYTSGDLSGNISGELSGEESGEFEEPVPVYTGPKVFSGDSRSIAFMIDNDVKAAWPHAGLNNAYMIYEVVVEGGASRLIAFFKYDNIPDHIGPIRSCRHYFLDYVQEHDALYCHYGQSTQGGEAIKSRKITNINGIYVDYCDRIGPDKTWHNAFANKTKLEKYITKQNYRTTQNQDCIIKFNEVDTDLVSGDIANMVICKYSGFHNTSFQYDEESKQYLISMRDVPHVDKFTDERFVAKNILVYQVGNNSLWNEGDTREEDNKKRQNIYNTGDGKGYYITNGMAIPMKWSKPTHGSKTVYKDMNGNELSFNDGITWVEIIPDGGSVSIKE